MGGRTNWAASRTPNGGDDLLLLLLLLEGEDEEEEYHWLALRMTSSSLMCLANSSFRSFTARSRCTRAGQQKRRAQLDGDECGN